MLIHLRFDSELGGLYNISAWMQWNCVRIGKGEEMRKPSRTDGTPGAGFSTIICILAFFLISAPAYAAQTAESMNIATSLLVISFVLCVCMLVVSGFTLWQSHRYYLDTVRLSREITATTTELHHKVVDLIFNLKDFLAHESEMVQSRTRRTSKAKSAETSDRVGKIVSSISSTENKIRALEKTLDKLNRQLSFNFQPADISQQLADLSDIEYAVLFKLSQDPRFFEEQSFSSFGATPKVLDSLLSRQLIIFDKDGKAKVPNEVAVSIRHTLPEN